MNEKTRDTIRTNDGTRARGCDRAGDLVAYLYGESAPEDGATFQRHLDSCAVCRDEMAAFGDVRGLVGAWRADALSAAPSLDVDELIAPAGFSVKPAPARTRSALAALREFFALSPPWLQAGAVAATLVVCALAALTFARTEIRRDADGFAFQTGVSERVIVKTIEVPAPNGYTKEQVNEIVGRELEVARKQWQSEQEQNQAEINTGASQRQAAPRSELVSQQPKNRKRSVQPQPQRDRQNLAKFKDEDDDLPRLSDLLGGVY